MVALYCTAKLAYMAGCEMTEMSQQYEMMKRETLCAEPEQTDDKPEESQTDIVPQSEKLPGKEKRGIFSRFIGAKTSVIKDIFSHLDDQKLEAYVDGEEVVMRIKRAKARLT